MEECIKIIENAFRNAKENLEKQEFRPQYYLLHNPRFNLTSDERYSLQVMPLKIPNNTGELEESKNLIEIRTNLWDNGKRYSVYESFNKSEVTEKLILSKIDNMIEHWNQQKEKGYEDSHT